MPPSAALQQALLSRDNGNRLYRTDLPRRYSEGMWRQAGDRIYSHYWDRPYDNTRGFGGN